MSPRFVLSLMLLIAGPGFAAEPDCQAAFTLLRELGFPDVSGGHLVHTEESNRSRYYSSDQIEDINGLPVASAWRMGAPDQKPAVLFDLFGRPFHMISEDSGSESAGEEPPDPEAISGVITSLNPHAYAVGLTNLLASLENETPDEDVQFFLASSFFLAAGLYQNGYQAEAVAITDRVLALLPDPEAFLAACVGILADSAYEDSLARFLADGNWLAFADRVKAIRRQFGRRWADGEAAGEVENSARRRAEQGAVSLPVGDFPSWAVACLREIVSDNPLDVRPLNGIESYPWVLAPPPDPALSQTQACPIVRLLDEGMASVPLLLAIATNSTPLRLSNRNPGAQLGANERAMEVFQRALRGEGNSRTIQYSYNIDPFAMGGGDPSSRLARPMMLGELSLRLLRPLLPGSVNREDDALPALRAWYEAHRQDTRFELALARLKDENNGPAYVAMSILMTDGSDTDRQRVEKTILEMTDSPDQAIPLAFEYVKFIEPAKAADFRSRFAEQIRKSIPTPVTNDVDPNLFVGGSQDRSRSSRNVDGMLKAFEKGDETDVKEDLNSVLDKLVTTNTVLPSSVLYVALHRADRDRAVALLTNAVLRVSTPEQRSQLIWCLASLREMEPAGGEGDEKQEAAHGIAPPWRPAAEKTVRAVSRRVRERSALPQSMSLEALGPFWRILLTDTRPDEWAEVRSRTALVIEGLYGDKVDNRMEVRAILGEVFDRLLIERSLARLEGRSIPPVPTLRDAGNADRVGLEQRLLALPDSELAAAVAKLEPASVLALSTGTGDDPALAARLGAMAGRVSSVSPGLGLSPGTTLGTADVARLVNTLRESKEPGRISIKIERKPQAGGVLIERSTALPPSSDYQYRYSGSYEMMQMKALSPHAPLLYARIELLGREGRRLEDGGAAVFWFLEENQTADASGKAPDPDARLDSRRGPRYSEANSEQFWESVGRFCAATNLPLAPAAIRLYRIPSDDWTTIAESGSGGEYFE